MQDKELQPISASEFYKMVDIAAVQETYQHIISNNLSLKASTKYSVLVNNDPFPPKDFLRVMAQLKSYEINEATLNGGQANKPFEKLGYTIVNNKDYPFYNASVLQPQIRKYQNAIDNTDWLKVREIYKFNFVKWIEENIDFNNDSDDTIKSKIEQSQQIAYSPDSNTKGVNFIQTITRYQDDYLTLEDLQKLRNVVNQEVEENKENLTLSFNSFPKTSAFLSFFKPEQYIAYDSESLPAYEFLSKGVRNSAPPKMGYNAFQFYQIFYQNIKKHLKESHLDVSTFKEILQLENLSELQWNFIAQDFLLFVTREIMNKDINTIDITGHKIYKLSMGSFLKDRNYDHIDPIEQFEKNNLVVMHSETAYNQGSDFANKLKIGDYIYLTYGQQRLSFIAKIIEDAKPVNQVMDIELEDQWICRKVEIVKTPVINNTNDLKDKTGWLPSGYSTFKEIPDLTKANEILFNKYYNVDVVNRDIDDKSKSQNNPSKLNHPLNQILYGPPGTGKTYKTKALAVEIIDGFAPEDREELTVRYYELMDAGQIHFTTFHQSMSYEDFIEGIKPKLDNEEEGEVSYEIKDGIFKSICKKASKKVIVSDKVQDITEPFDIAWDKLIEQVKEKLSNDELLKIGSWEYGLSSKESLKYESLNSPSKYTFTITKKNIYDTYQGKLARPSGAFQKDMKDILNFMKSEFNLNDFEEILLVEEKQPHQKYVLIIDEINRGNVSAIFGELITLIENDKRAGKDEAIEVTLPYSKEKFSVPKNIHIIGTMNTADRSVEALDTALRRRFSFTEMLPDLMVLEQDHETNGIITENNAPISLVELLKTINERIELLIDKDHQIGHSYFFNVKNFESLKVTFKDKIIPLLEEYFYGDFGKIGLVLGGHFVKPKESKNKTILAQNFKFETEFIEEKELYEFVNADDWTIETFTSIYLNTLTVNE